MILTSWATDVRSISFLLSKWNLKRSFFEMSKKPNTPCNGFDNFYKKILNYQITLMFAQLVVFFWEKHLLIHLAFSAFLVAECSSSWPTDAWRRAGGYRNDQNAEQPFNVTFPMTGKPFTDFLAPARRYWISSSLSTRNGETWI